MFLEWAWWKFFIVVILLFMGCLFINYVMKKYNEARIEERFARLLEKASNSQGTQIQEISLKMETAQLLPIPSKDSDENNPKNAGIPLLAHKEDNVYDFRNNDSTNAIINTKLWDLEQEIEASKKTDDILNKKSMTSVKQEQDQKTENIKTKTPGSITIKDSKNSVDMQTTLSLPKDQNQAKELESSKKLHDNLIPAKSDSFIKKYNLDSNPTIVNDTNIGDTKDSAIVCNDGSELGLKESQISQKNHTALSEETNRVLNATGADEPNVKAMTNISNITIKDSKLVCDNSTERELQKPDTPQIYTALSIETNGEPNANATKEPNVEAMTNISNIIIEESKITCNISTESGLQKQDISRNIYTRLSRDTNRELNPNDVKEPNVTAATNIDNNTNKYSEIVDNNSTGLRFQEPETSPKIETTLSKTNRELNATNTIEPKVKAITDSINSAHNITEISRIPEEFPQKISNSSLKTDNLELKTSSARNTNYVGVLIKDATPVDSDSSYYRQNSDDCGILLLEASDNSSKKDTSEENASDTTLASTLMKIKNDGGTSTITIGLLMTEISRKTPSLKINKLATNATKPNFGNISIKSSQHVLTGSSDVELQLSVMSKKTNKTLHPDHSLSEKKIEFKSIKATESLEMNQPTRTLHALTVSDPQTSIISQSKESNIPHKSSNTSTNKYNQKLKRFWGSFLSKAPT